MKPIFISYSSKHRDLTGQLADVIEAQYGAGSVWWDHDLESRASYSTQIKAALEKARVIVVIWTAEAMISDYVYAEALSAQEQGKLVNVRPADLSFRAIPEPFNIHHVDEAEDHGRILATIAKVMAGTPIPTRVPLHEIYFRQHGHRLIDPKQRKLARDPRDISPTDLLHAKYEVVDYIDVSGTRAALIDWCTCRSRTTAGRLIYGPGGLGKTRLMISVAATMRMRGWTAGFLEHPNEQVDITLTQRWQALDQLIVHGEDEGLLIVIDYAEARQDEVKSIAKRLNRRAQHDARPIRLVLLARSAGNWWIALHDDIQEVQRIFRSTSTEPDVIALPNLATGQQRLDLFDQSLESFAPRLAAQGYNIPTGKPSDGHLRSIANDAGYARPLAVQMTTLLWLASVALDEGGTRVDVLLRRVLGMERNHWRKLLGTLDDDGIRDMARGVAQVTLSQGVPSRDAAERLLMSDDFYAGRRTARVSVDPVFRHLSRVHGMPNGGIGALEPNLIGEHHVATVGDIELIDGYLSWIETEPDENRKKHRRDLLAVLQRASQPEHGAEANDQVITLLGHLVNNHLQTLAAEMVAIIMEIPGALLDRLNQKIDTADEESLCRIDTALPIKSLSLMDLSLHVSTRLVDLAREHLVVVEGAGDDTTPDQHEITLNHLAGRVGTLGIRLFNLGRREDSLAVNQEAVEIYRRLAKARPDVFLPDLATSLNNLGNGLSRLGRREEALAASQEAVKLRRRLAKTQPDVFLPDLANGLNNLGIGLFSLGHRRKALAASQEAVEIYRHLEKTRPDVFLPDLANSLNNLCRDLASLGRHVEALASSQDAVKFYRRLEETRPDAFLSDLASSLNNLGIGFSSLGRHEEANVVRQEAIEIHRRLAKARPDVFLPDLATSLNNLGVGLSYLGRREEALGASQEAVEIYRRLEESRPDVFLPDLAKSLNNLGNTLSRLGRREEALDASQEAVDIYRRLAKAQPVAFLPDLANSLNVLSDILSKLDQNVEAALQAHHAFEILKPFVERYPETYGVLARAIDANVRRYSKATAETPN